MIVPKSPAAQVLVDSQIAAVVVKDGRGGAKPRRRFHQETLSSPAVFEGREGRGAESKSQNPPELASSSCLFFLPLPLLFAQVMMMMMTGPISPGTEP